MCGGFSRFVRKRRGAKVKAESFFLLRCSLSLSRSTHCLSPPPTTPTRLIPSSARAGAGASAPPPTHPFLPPTATTKPLPRCRPRPSSPRRRRCVERGESAESAGVGGRGAAAAARRGPWLVSPHRARRGCCATASAHRGRDWGIRAGGRAGRRARLVGAGAAPPRSRDGGSPMPAGRAAPLAACGPSDPEHCLEWPRPPAATPPRRGAGRPSRSAGSLACGRPLRAGTGAADRPLLPILPSLTAPAPPPLPLPPPSQFTVRPKAAPPAGLL